MLCALERTCPILVNLEFCACSVEPNALCNSMDVEILYSVQWQSHLHGGFCAYESEAVLNSAHVLVRLFGECKGENLSLVSDGAAQALPCRRTVCGKILARCAK
jgi:hypothetical protein